MDKNVPGNPSGPGMYARGLSSALSACGSLIYIYLYQFLVAMGSFVSEQNFNYFLDSFNLFVIL